MNFMYNKSLFKPLLVIGIVATVLLSCDKDYDELGTDIVGENHYGFDNYTGASIKAVNQDLGPISSNDLAINPLGFYEDPAFGNTHANFVTQVVLSSEAPVFNNQVVGDYQTLPVMDSVIVDIPYFSTLEDTDDEGKHTYTLDSIYGTEGSKFKLSIYQSNYFLRDFDPDQSFGAKQLYYTNQDALIDANKVPLLLNDNVDTDEHENNQFYFDKREHKTMVLGDDGVTPTYPRSVPSMRLHLNKTVFNDLILNGPTSKLASNEVFKNYFRGLYFKTTSIGNPGNMAMLNFANGKITLYYKEDKKNTVINTDGTTTITYDRVNKSFALNLTGRTVSLLDNTRTGDYTAAMNNAGQEASRLYVKGGAGSMALIDVFGATDLKGLAPNPNFNSNLPISYTNPKYLLSPTYNPNLPISDTNLKYVVTGPNGVSDEIDNIRAQDWLINEANLTFYVDKTAMASNKRVTNRIYLYDVKNKKLLADYTQDGTTLAGYPKLSKYIYGGIFINDEGKVVNESKDEKAFKYKIRITNHVRNLISKDSTNVKLGLVVTENILGDHSAFSKRQTPGSDAIISAPSLSVMNPLGIILYGTNTSSTDDAKKLKLEIFYTKPN
jgi:hypothetical protein